MGTFKNEHNVIVLISVNSDFLYQDRRFTHWKFVACIKRGFIITFINDILMVYLLFEEMRLLLTRRIVTSFWDILNPYLFQGYFQK
jgi:hypothetical protein